MKFEGKKVGEYAGANLYEVEVEQEPGIVYAYTVSESDLKWLNDNDKSKWDVKYVAVSFREI
jgi:hypothetical protein